MNRSVKHSATGNIFRVKLITALGAGLPALTSASSGLIISTICDNEAAPVVYTAAAGTVEAVSTLGTFAAPTATKCRFKKVDDTNNPGLYELQLADARFAVAGAKELHVTILGVATLLETDFTVQLQADDPQAAKLSDAARVILEAGLNTVATGTVGSASTTTSVVTSAISPAAAVTDQFKNRLITFSDATTTVNLRGQSATITGSSAAGILTVTALTTAPVSGDTFVIA
jgi:hypothetical protein